MTQSSLSINSSQNSSEVGLNTKGCSCERDSDSQPLRSPSGWEFMDSESPHHNCCFDRIKGNE
jgi:hypothetical protein